MCEGKSCEGCDGKEHRQQPLPLSDREKVVILRQALMQIIQVESDSEFALVFMERGISEMSATEGMSDNVATAQNAVNALRRCRDAI